ncbi:MAG: hypothetical protein AAF716_05145 [Cyanobacteria bacterium P01_D01_bin.1]
MQSLISEFDEVIFHFDGNNNDPDDIAALPMAAAIAKSANLQDKITFFYGNNLSEPNNSNMEKSMRESGAFAKKLGIDAYSYQDGIQATTDKVVKILNSGKQILAIEGGPMEAIYRALERVSPANRANLTLLSHSSWNENRSVGSRPGGGKPRTWSDIRADFPQVTQIDIKDQNGGANSGFNNPDWKWLDGTSNPVLKEARVKMKNAKGAKANDPSDAGMLFYAITGKETANPEDAKSFFDQSPPNFGNLPTPPTVPPQPPTKPPVADDVVYLGKNGDVILEAESASPKGNWKIVTRKGQQVTLYDGPNSFNKANPEQTLSYSFETDQSGKHSIALHSLRDDRVMSERRNDLGNDAFIAIENAQTGKVVQAPTKLFTYFGAANNEYRWGTTFDAKHKKSPAEVSLKANTQYRLLVTGRSDGYAIDRITLSRGGFLKDASTPASPIKGDPAPQPPAPPASPPPSPPTPIETDIVFSLVDADTNQIVEGYEDLSANSTVDLKDLDLENYSIVAQVKGDQAKTVESIQFKSKDGIQTENLKPYALFGDRKGNYEGMPASQGKYTLEAVAYSKNGGMGNALAQASLNYTLTDTTNTPSPPPLPTPKPTPPEPVIPLPKTGLISFALVDAKTDQIVKGFEDLGTQRTFNAKTLGLQRYNLVAKINPDSPEADAVESVVFEGTAGDRIENFEPYASFGDIKGDYMGKKVVEGEDYLLKATAYTQDKGKGDALGTATLNYAFVSEMAAAANGMSKLGMSASHSLSLSDDELFTGIGRADTSVEPVLAGAAASVV